MQWMRRYRRDPQGMFCYKYSAWQLVLCLIVLSQAEHRCVAQTAASEASANRASAEAITPAKPVFNFYTPLTQKERLRHYFQHMFNVESVFRSAAGAGINQALDIPHEWQQGGEGYALRFASSYGEHIIQSTVMYSTSAVLHEDNRYFLSGRSGFKARLKYAIASSFMAHHDDGSMHVSISRLSSYAAAATISRLWQPPSGIGPIHAVDSFAISIGVETGFNVAREFLPGILHSNRPVAMSQNPAQ